MIGFWIAAVLLSVAAAGLVIAGALRLSAREGADPAQQLRRRQLAEIEDLIGRGVMAPEEARAIRTEASRRLLAAASDAPAPPAAWAQKGRAAVIGLSLLAPVVAAGLYLKVGSPGTPGQAFAKRLAVWEQAEPQDLQPGEMAAVLTDMTKHRPPDPEMFKALAKARLAAGDPVGAEAALHKALALDRERPDLWSLLGTARVQSGDGAQVDSGARNAFNEALKRDPTLLGPRYFLARGRIAEGKVSEGLSQLNALASELPADAPGREQLMTEISAITTIGGLVDAARPNGGDPKAVNAAIQGMVQRLAARLETKPDDPEGWVRLVRAYGVLGDKPKADAALAKAKARYTDRPEILAQLDQARAGGAAP
jgi:cytochrome c-type biogenesis protein CcmH